MLNNQQKQFMVENYIKAYNAFDVDGMMTNLHENVSFKNISNGQTTLALEGSEAFREQATQALAFFTTREQRIMQIQVKEAQVTVEIDYQGVLAQDLPNGPKAGETLQLNGQSVFCFEADKIVEIQDIS